MDVTSGESSVGGGLFKTPRLLGVLSSSAAKSLILTFRHFPVSADAEMDLVAMRADGGPGDVVGNVSGN